MLHPTPYSVIITPKFDPQKSQGGIWIPETSQERCDQGVIKYMGKLVPVEYLFEGAYVLFSGYSGTLLNLEDEGLVLIMDYREIVAIIDVPATEIPGLYFKGIDGNYHQCTYEHAVESINIALQEDKFMAHFIRYGWPGKSAGDNKLTTKNLSYEQDGILSKNGWPDENDKD